MGKLNSTYLIGAIGPVVFYEFRGKLTVRSKPDKVRRSKATKDSAKDFGLATKYSMRLRAGLHNLVQLYHDRSLMYRMNTFLLRWLRSNKEANAQPAKSMQAMMGMELNEQVQFNRRLKLEPVVDFTQPGKIVVSIPAFNPADIKAPAGTNKIQLSLVATRCNTDTERVPLPQRKNVYKTELEFAYKQALLPVRQVEIPFEILPGDIVIVAIGINYRRSDGGNEMMLPDPKWVNGKVVGVEYRE